MRRIAFALLFLAFTAVCVSCGVKGSPVPPGTDEPASPSGESGASGKSR